MTPLTLPVPQKLASCFFFSFICCYLQNMVEYIYIYIYRERERERERDGLWCIAMHGGVCALDHKSSIQNSNDRSKPFILFSILICAWRPNFTFFGIFLLFIKPL